jgi:hypothetical protein
MLRLYRGTKKSPLLHPIDAQGWLSMGWSKSLPDTQNVQNQIQQKETTQTERQDRENELMDLYYGASGEESNWRAIKSIADSLGIEKPAEGWEEAIPLILKAEGY